MARKKVEIIKKILKFPCYTCSTKGKVDGKKCKTCNGTGVYKENHYYHIVNGICIDGDTVK